MAEFYAWAVTGAVTGYGTWTAPGDDQSAAASSDDAGHVRIASRMVRRQKFVLCQHDGCEAEVLLTDSSLTFRNGQTATAVWVAHEGSEHGHCVYVENHTTGTSARLPSNVTLIRPKASLRRIGGYGALATLPAALALLTWLFMPGIVTGINEGAFVFGAVAAILVLFLVGALVSKMIWDAMRAEDEEKIWRVVHNAMNGGRHAPSAQVRHGP